ncbi:MAG: hypothetical protein IKW90_09110 [Lachnospiraceae bacterium]|nr:hypothetical protein [Lachnospiraceae bacterium]
MVRTIINGEEIEFRIGKYPLGHRPDMCFVGIYGVAVLNACGGDYPCDTPLSVNIDADLGGPDRFFYNQNKDYNLRPYLQYLLDVGYVKKTDVTGDSGWVTYPVYQITEKFKKEAFNYM